MRRELQCLLDVMAYSKDCEACNKGSRADRTMDLVSWRYSNDMWSSKTKAAERNQDTLGQKQDLSKGSPANLLSDIMDSVELHHVLWNRGDSNEAPKKWEAGGMEEVSLVWRGLEQSEGSEEQIRAIGTKWARGQCGFGMLIGISNSHLYWCLWNRTLTTTNR